MRLPDPELNLPAASRGAIARFWLRYWLAFFALLPWMLVRQAAITAADLLAAAWTTGRRWRLLDGDLEIGFVGCAELLVTAGMFGERFTWLRWRDVLIDPGPRSARDEVLAALRDAPTAAVVATHFHEEHIGNAAALAAQQRAPLLASAATLPHLRAPETIPDGRRLLMGQPEAAPAGVELVALADRVVTPAATLEVVDAPGHCPGHVALYDRARRVLFAGDAFLHELYTAPNRDSEAQAWIATLERFAALDVATLVGAHGSIRSSDPAVPRIFGVVRRDDPNRRIAAKLAFLRWAQAVVAAGERRGLPYSVIEACLFPWRAGWAWRTWFHDEGFRLLTCGEFSRTHFVRSLSAHAQRVPVRFPAFAATARALAATGPELLRIHVLAARPLPVLVISASVALSALLLAAVARAAGALPSGDPRALLAAGPELVRHHPLALAVVLAGWTWWWAVVGGGITRVMGLAVTGGGREDLRTAAWRCRSPAVFVPSALASACLLMCACAAAWPWLLLAMPPVWLVAGFLYGALCVDLLPLRAALAALGVRLHRPGRLVRRQALFLCGFAASTAVVYAVAGAWVLLAGWLAGGLTTPLGLAVAAPALVYALGYTTANLKSLQIRLYARP